MSFAENLRKTREMRGISAKDFAYLIGIKYTTYTAYENQGREPKYDTLRKIAAALHISIDELLDYKASEPTKLDYWNKLLESLDCCIIRHKNELEIKKGKYTIGYTTEKSLLHKLETISATVDRSLKPSRDYMLTEQLHFILSGIRDLSTKRLIEEGKLIEVVNEHREDGVTYVKYIYQE